MRQVSHTTARRRPAPATVAHLLRNGTARLARAKLHYGHGTDSARDDAAALLGHAMRLRRPLDDRDLLRPASDLVIRRYQDLLQRRITERVPAVYLTNQCWFAGVRMHVDERVLIPRSPIAELVESRFTPWVDPDAVRRIADLGTGSGCIALTAALAFPRARVDAVDVSTQALAVARINRAALGLTRRVRLVESDFFARLGCRRYDIIVSNPPYVGTAEFTGLPPEYGHEPAGALLSGTDGMDAVRVLLSQSAAYLTERGVLVVEVGNTEEQVRRAFPRLPCVWLSFARGGGGVFLLTAAQLRAADL